MEYKDKAFCVAAENCALRDKCGRWLTDEEKKKIPHWMPVGWIPKCKDFRKRKGSAQ